MLYQCSLWKIPYLKRFTHMWSALDIWWKYMCMLYTMAAFVLVKQVKCSKHGYPGSSSNEPGLGGFHSWLLHAETAWRPTSLLLLWSNGYLRPARHGFNTMFILDNLLPPVCSHEHYGQQPLVVEYLWKFLHTGAEWLSPEAVISASWVSNWSTTGKMYPLFILRWVYIDGFSLWTWINRN